MDFTVFLAVGIVVDTTMSAFGKRTLPSANASNGSQSEVPKFVALVTPGQCQIFILSRTQCASRIVTAQLLQMQHMTRKKSSSRARKCTLIETGAHNSAIAFEDSMEAIIDDVLTELEPDDVHMIVDFCSDWAEAFW
jgi:hypothetical protein